MTRRKSIPEITRRIGVESVRGQQKGNSMWTAQFWKDATERAVKTFAQTLAAVLGAGAVDILAVEWTSALAVSGGAALVSALTSLGSERFGNDGTASATTAVEPATTDA